VHATTSPSWTSTSKKKIISCSPWRKRQLSEAALAELSKGFDRIEEQKIGVGKHEEFHQMIDQLERVYLK